MIEESTCVRFIESTDPMDDFTDHVHVYPGSGCASYVGVAGGGQRLSLRHGGCMVPGIVAHEFLHALGEKDWAAPLQQ